MIVLSTVIFVVFVSSTGTQAQKEGRIFGGTTTSIDFLGCLMAITNTKRELIAHGALISSSYVLTSAAPLIGEQQKNLIVQGGSDDIEDNGWIHRLIKEIHVFPSFNATTLKDDLAIIKLRVPMCGNNIRTCKIDYTAECSKECAIIAGFGSLKSRGEISRERKIGRVRALTYYECMETVMKPYIHESNGCHLPCDPKTNTDACDGDSGGPTFVNGKICNVLSWGFGCNGTLPGVTTLLYPKKKWIEDTINKEY